MTHIMLYHNNKHTTYCLYHPKYRDLKWFTEAAILVYSGI